MLFAVKLLLVLLPDSFYEEIGPLAPAIIFCIKEVIDYESLPMPLFFSTDCERADAA